jgi:hypothetical protein
MSVSPLISIRFILNTVADITNIDTWLKREDKQKASKTTPVWGMDTQHVWLDFKAHDPDKIRVCILVILDKEGEMVVDKMMLILALHSRFSDKNFNGIIPQIPLKKFAIPDMPLSVTQMGPIYHWDIYGIDENCNGIWGIAPISIQPDFIDLT